MKNVSPLRYPGGKSRACIILDEVLNKYYDVEQFTHVISPFFGGGSFEFYLQNTYNWNIIANDKFLPLYSFWIACKNNKDKMCKKLYKKINNITRKHFYKYREKIMNEENVLKQGCYYFMINRCSFSGATLSGGFSKEASKKRFTTSSVKRIENLDLSCFEMYNDDFKVILTKYNNDAYFMFLDPPYYIDNPKLYGNNGDMHENFDHKKLYKYISKKINWILTYNDCYYIRNLYNKYTIINVNWKYGMNKTKQSSEIIILG